jgi:hypothetical protein
LPIPHEQPPLITEEPIISTDLQHRAEEAAAEEGDEHGRTVIPGIKTNRRITEGEGENDDGEGHDEVEVQRSNGQETDKGRIARLRREAYSSATARIRDENRDIFNRLMKEECDKRDVEWTPRPDEEGRALETMRELLARYPNLQKRLSLE